MLQIWKLKKTQKETLPIVIPLVLYHGKTQWKVALRLSDLLEYKEESLLRYVPDFQYVLYDLSGWKDEDIRGIKKLQVMLYLLKYVWSPDLLERLGKILRLLKDIPESDMDFVVSLTVYLLYTRELELPKLAALVEENISRKGGEVAMTTAEKLMLQGEEIGIEKGRKEGEEIGIKKGKLEGIELALELKFGANGLSLMDEVYKTSDLEKLTRFQQRIKTAQSVEELRQELG